MRQPKRTKFRKAFKGRISGISKGGTSLAFGEFGLKALEPETSDAYEIGLKSSLMGGALTINLAGFYAKYDNFQANNPDSLTIGGVTTVIGRFTNAGSVSTRGVELDFAYRPTRDFTISGGAAYTDAHIDQFRVPAVRAPTDVVPNRTRLPYAPRFKGSISADYRIRTGGAVDVALGMQANYQSEQDSTLTPDPVIRYCSRPALFFSSGSPHGCSTPWSGALQPNTSAFSRAL